jgi:hypothetical protein
MESSIATAIADASADSTINPTVVRKPPIAPIDPFDSYSILKPAVTEWMVSKQGRHPGVIAAVLLIAMTAVVGAFYSFGYLIDSKASLVDFAKAASRKNETGKAAVQQSKSERPRASASGVVVVPAATAAEATRKNEKQKHPARRSDSVHPKAPNVTPPPFSISP